MEPKEGPMPQRSLGSGSGLPYNSFVDSVSSLTPTAEDKEKPAISPRRSYVAVAVLCYVNLLNYSERYTIAGVLPDIQTFFDISDSMAALIQTVFISSFLLLAPVFGYLGDRYNRKYIMIGGLSVWLVTAAGSSLVTKSYFWLLMLLRAMVGIGEASYSTIAPTIIGDLFVGTRRSAMICLFYICIPVGSGLGYITGAGVAHLTGDWRWALRVTPILGLVGLVLLVLLCPNPTRGAAETPREEVTGESSYPEDVKYLLKNKSYVWSSLGVTATSFLTGALAFWAPTFLSRAQVSQGLQLPCVKEPCNPTDSYIFGAVTVVTGVLGAFLGSCLSRWFGKRIPNVDPLICAIGLVGSAPCLFFTIFAASKSITATYVFIFFAEMLISLNWAVMADILLSIVIPTRRSTAEALQISVCHLLGDAGSPYFVGLISDAIRKSEPATHDWSFRSLQYSLVVCPFVAIVGGLFFFVTSLYITEDRKALAKLVEGAPQPQQGANSEPPIELSNKDKRNPKNNVSVNI
ncbi:protein spinster homolog 3 isoform X1 [Cyclopterus lumpus]|uniref:SPNS lysolipid transporter 3, sphingosine-1-phosphate (putative) n=1 Tax=Cyclopterus lumpus TaxID=8103 RepID=A0A8C2ZW77_CYCLU|nr:protein spinster homolog 3 isoform X1 [Cyclopterus lumpus]XP_034406635.1 protein spinster homolog 3 isoform X1 [Cyclopterus lumpus]